MPTHSLTPTFFLFLTRPGTPDHQENEREKLRLELSLQALRQAFAFKVFSWQQLEAEDTEQETDGAAGGPHAHAASGHACCGCASQVAAGPTHVHTHADGGSAGAKEEGGGDGLEATEEEAVAEAAEEEPVAEATEQEFNDAVGEAALALDRIVLEVNEVLEEVRYAIAEEEEAEGGAEGEAAC